MLNCGCLPNMAYTASTIDVPAKTDYPISFIGGLQGMGYDQIDQTWWVGFTKSGPSTPWLVAFLTGYKAGEGITGADPYTDYAPPPVPTPLPLAPGEFVDYFQKLETTGVPGSGLPVNYGPDNLINTDVKVASRLYRLHASEGLKQQVAHRIDQVSPVFPISFNGRITGAMECFAVNVTDVESSPSGARMVQPSDRSAWPQEIPPGTYKVISTDAEFDQCVVEGSNGLVNVYAEDGGIYSYSATPA